MAKPAAGWPCLSEGSDPVLDPRITKLIFENNNDNAALNARRLLDGKFGNKSKVESMRPGKFCGRDKRPDKRPDFRETGIKRPLVIRGDGYVCNPHMGIGITDTGLTAAQLEERMDKDREVETWDVSKQQPGPQWKLAQFTTYWHARQQYVQQQALDPVQQQTVAAGLHNGSDPDKESDLADDADSSHVLILQRTGTRPQANAQQMGISAIQATRLVAADHISMEYVRPRVEYSKPPLADDMHLPDVVMACDLVRYLEQLPCRDGKAAAHNRPAPPTAAAAAAGADGTSGGAAVELPGEEQQAGPDPQQQQAVTDGRAPGERLARRESERLGLPPISPNQTIHLQMSPVGSFMDFRAAPGGAASWLYVLTGSKVFVLLPPTAKNRSLYMAWAQASLAQTSKTLVLDVCLADYAEDAVRVEVKQSDALLIPCGWFYASVTLDDCIAVCSYFWHMYALGDIARTQHLQLHLKQRDTELCRRARQLMWCAALSYTKNLRERHGLPPYRPHRPRGTASGQLTPSSSFGSGMMMQQQQPRPSPRGRGGGGTSLPAAPTSSGGNRRTPRGTPPLAGLAAALQQHAAADTALLSPAQSPSARRALKRGRADAGMDALLLPESAIPLQDTPAGYAAAAAAAGGAASAGGCRTPRATSSAAAAAAALNAPSGHKKLKLNTMSGVGATTPRSAALDGSGAAKQQQHAQPQPQRSADTHSGGRVPAGSYQQQQTSSGSLRIRLKGSTPRHHQQQQQQQQTRQDRQRWSYYSAAVDEDEEGDCQTSPVRHAVHDHQYVDMFDAQDSDAAPRSSAGLAGPAAAGGGWQQPGGQQQYRQVDMSPIVGGMRGDTDSLPPLNMGAPVLSMPPAPRADAGPAQTHATAAAAAAAAATPRVPRLRIKVSTKTPPHSLPAATPQPSAPAIVGTAAAAEATALAAAEGTGGNSPGAGRSGEAAAAPAVSRRSTPEESCCRQSSHSTQQQQQGSGSNEAPQQQQQQQGAQRQDEQGLQQRRVSDCANSKPRQPPQAPAAAGGAAGSSRKPTKIRFKGRLTPSPLLAPQLGALEAVPPMLLGPSTLEQQQQQQQGAAPAQRFPVVPPLRLHAIVAQQQQEQQQQPLEAGSALPSMQPPQVDGAGDAVQGCSGAAAVQQTNPACKLQQQQQQCSLWLRWQQLQQAAHHFGQQQQQQRELCGSSADAWHQGSIPQCDGAGDDVRSHTPHGPTLVMQPAPAGNAAATGSPPQQQRQRQIPSSQGQRPPFGSSRGGGSAGLNRAALPPARWPPAAATGRGLQGVTTGGGAAAAAVTALGGRMQVGSWPHDESPFEREGAGAAAFAALPGTGPQLVPAAAAAAAAGLEADASDAHMQDAAAGNAGAAAAAAAAAWPLSRVGSSLPQGSGDLGPAAAAAAAVPTAGAAAAAAAGEDNQPSSRTNSPTGQPGRPDGTTAAAPAAPAPAMQPQPSQAQPLPSQAQMLPPPPTKVSSWELAELPVLLQYLQEQVAVGSYGDLRPCELPPGLTDPGFMLEQLQEAVEVATQHEQEMVAATLMHAADAAAAPAAAASGGAASEHQQLQQQQQAGGGEQEQESQQHGGGRAQQAPEARRTLPELAQDAADWQELCGELHPEPLQPDAMRLDVEFTAALQQGYELQRTKGWGDEQREQADVIEPVVAESADPQAASSSFHSCCSLAGTARAAREAAAARDGALAVGAPRGGGGGAGAAAVAAAAGGGGGGGVVQKRPPQPATKGEAQAKKTKVQNVRKGLNLRL